MQKSARIDAEYCVTKVLRLLSNGWHQGSSAAVRSGRVTTFDDDNATSFDIAGAFLHVWHRYLVSGAVQQECQQLLTRLIGVGVLENWEMEICRWNDMKGRTKLEVLELIGRMLQEVRHGDHRDKRR